MSDEIKLLLTLSGIVFIGSMAFAYANNAYGHIAPYIVVLIPVIFIIRRVIFMSNDLEHYRNEIKELKSKKPE